MFIRHRPTEDYTSQNWPGLR